MSYTTNFSKILWLWWAILLAGSIVFAWKTNTPQYEIIEVVLELDLDEHTIYMSGERTQDTDHIIRTPLIRQDWNNAWSWLISLRINPHTPSLDALYIKKIHASPTMDYAYKVLIDQFISQELDTNILEKSWTKEFSLSNTSQFLWSQVIVTATWSDTNNFKQTTTFVLDYSCVFKKTRNALKVCPIKGKYHITTPLIAGDIAWNIQGTLTTTILQ